MAGSIVVTSADLGGGYTKYSVAWTASAGGAVSGNSFDLKRGRLMQAKFIPGSGGTQPSDLYDATLLDADNFDLLRGLGGDLSNAESIVVPQLSGAGAASGPLIFFEGGPVTPTIANAGNVKTGTLVLHVGP